MVMVHKNQLMYRRWFYSKIVIPLIMAQKAAGISRVYCSAKLMPQQLTGKVN